MTNPAGNSPRSRTKAAGSEPYPPTCTYGLVWDRIQELYDVSADLHASRFAEPRPGLLERTHAVVGRTRAVVGRRLVLIGYAVAGQHA